MFEINILSSIFKSHFLHFVRIPSSYNCQNLFSFDQHLYEEISSNNCHSTNWGVISMCTIRSKVFAYTEYYLFIKIYEESTNTEYRILLFSPNYSRILNNQIIRCNSEINDWTRAQRSRYLSTRGENFQVKPSNIWICCLHYFHVSDFDFWIFFRSYVIPSFYFLV